MMWLLFVKQVFYSLKVTFVLTETFYFIINVMFCTKSKQFDWFFNLDTLQVILHHFTLKNLSSLSCVDDLV